MELSTSYTILPSPHQPTSETYSKPTTYTLHLETLYLQIHAFLYFPSTYSLPSSLQTFQLIYAYASLVFPMHTICQTHVTYITNWLNWFNTMDDNRLSKIILHYKPKGCRYTEKPLKKIASKLSRLHAIPCWKEED